MSWRTRLRYVMKWRCSPMITWILISQFLTFYSTPNFVNHTWSGSLHAAPEPSSGTSPLHCHLYLRDCSLIAVLKVYINLFKWLVLTLVSQVQLVWLCDSTPSGQLWSTLQLVCLILIIYIDCKVYSGMICDETDIYNRIICQKSFFCRFLERSLWHKHVEILSKESIIQLSLFFTLGLIVTLFHIYFGTCQCDAGF